MLLIAFKIDNSSDYLCQTTICSNLIQFHPFDSIVQHFMLKSRNQDDTFTSVILLNCGNDINISVLYIHILLSGNPNNN